MEYGDDLHLRFFLVSLVNDKVGTYRPEEHISWSQVGSNVTAARPLRQMFEGAEELFDNLLGGIRIIQGNVFLNLEKVLQRQWGELQGGHDSLLAACAAQPGSRLFRPDAFTLFQLLKAKINLRPDFGQVSLLEGFLLLKQTKRLADDFGSGSIAAALNPFGDPAFQFGSKRNVHGNSIEVTTKYSILCYSRTELFAGVQGQGIYNV